MRTLLGLLVALLTVGAAVTLLESDAKACAAAPALSATVSVAHEDALIVWDNKKHEESFIRQANFETNAGAAGFGFIVPTPSAPTLGEVDSTLFTKLEELVKPEVKHVTTHPVVLGCMVIQLLDQRTTDAPLAAPLQDAIAQASVTVLGQEVVAGLDASILAAKDVSSLESWLKAHDYAFRPELRAWATHYIEKGYVFTAFKFASKKVTANGAAAIVAPIAAQALRMTFTAEKAFYPYLEPEGQAPHPGRQLRLFVVAHENVTAQMSDLPAGPLWARQPPYSSVKTVLPAINGATLPEHATLTQFIDDSPLREASDLVFVGGGKEVLPPVVIVETPERLYVPIEAFFVLAGFAVILRRVMLNRSPKATTA